MAATALAINLSKLTLAMGLTPQRTPSCGMIFMKCSENYPGARTCLVCRDILYITRCRSWYPELPFSKFSMPFSNGWEFYRTVVPFGQDNLSLDLDPCDAMSLLLHFRPLCSPLVPVYSKPDASRTIG